MSINDLKLVFFVFFVTGGQFNLTPAVLVSSILIQTGKPDEAEVATNQAYTMAG